MLETRDVQAVSVVPITIQEANEFVSSFHRHNKPVQGARFAIGATFADKLVGVAIVGRPVARRLQDGVTAEVLRVCTDGQDRRLPNGHTVPICSTLYARCWRAWQAMGGARLITYTLATEPGASLRGAGWKVVGQTEPFAEGKGWTTRPGREWQPVNGQLKIRWEAGHVAA